MSAARYHRSYAARRLPCRHRYCPPVASPPKLLDGFEHELHTPVSQTSRTSQASKVGRDCCPFVAT
jgi:hypothetical protein